MRIAAIDIGTNSIHMVVAEASGAAGFEVLDREREVVQIGRGSFAQKRLHPDAIRRTVDALDRFVQLARRHDVDRIVCTATAAVREAENGGEFLSLATTLTGVAPRVIPSSEEGRLIYLGVRSALQLGDKPSLIVDIGGGSLQLVTGSRERLGVVETAPLGALRLTEQFLRSDPPSRRDLGRLRAFVRKTAREPLSAVLQRQPAAVYGSSGSIHALAHTAHWQETGEPLKSLNGHTLGLASLERLTRRLQRMSNAEREKLPGIDARRAEIIVPGAVVLLHIIEEAGHDGIVLSDYGVREGLVTDYVERHAQEISSTGKIGDLRLRSVMQCLTRLGADATHARHVADLALQLYDGFRSRHGYRSAERETLRFAALLHDVGAVIGYDGHGEHSYYVIRHANLRGFTPRELELVATVARYHGKARPRKSEASLRDLHGAERKLVRWFAALLRVAEGLDRSHYQLVRSVRVVRRGKAFTILAQTRPGSNLELWAARGRLKFLGRLVGLPVSLEGESASSASGRRHPGSRARRGKGVLRMVPKTGRAENRRGPVTAPSARAGR